MINALRNRGRYDTIRLCNKSEKSEREESSVRFYMPADVYEEENCVVNHAADLARLGSHALIVTGSHSAERNGSLHDVTEALESCRIRWTHFNEVEENPSVDTVMRARDLGLVRGCDFVIGVGGGSPMDAAKAIALMMRHGEADESYLFDASAQTDPLPIVCIPTTCGTGSEVTAASILTRPAIRKKGAIPHLIFADLALLDGKYLKNAPRHVLANTTMDAFAHLVESYLNAKATPYSRMCVAAGLKEWAGNKDMVLGKREVTAEACAAMLRASAFGGMSIAQTGTVLPHGLSYAVTVHTGMAHGKACGFFLRNYMAKADPADREAVLSMAGFADVDEFEAYYRATCGRDDVPDAVLELAVRDLLTNPAKMALAPFAVDEAVLRGIAGLGEV